MDVIRSYDDPLLNRIGIVTMVSEHSPFPPLPSPNSPPTPSTNSTHLPPTSTFNTTAVAASLGLFPQSINHPSLQNPSYYPSTIPSSPPSLKSKPHKWTPEPLTLNQNPQIQHQSPAHRRQQLPPICFAPSYPFNSNGYDFRSKTPSSTGPPLPFLFPSNCSAKCPNETLPLGLSSSPASSHTIASPPQPYPSSTFSFTPTPSDSPSFVGYSSKSYNQPRVRPNSLSAPPPITHPHRSKEWVDQYLKSLQEKAMRQPPPPYYIEYCQEKARRYPTPLQYNEYLQEKAMNSSIPPDVRGKSWEKSIEEEENRELQLNMDVNMSESLQVGEIVEVSMSATIPIVDVVEEEENDGELAIENNEEDQESEASKQDVEASSSQYFNNHEGHFFPKPMPVVEVSLGEMQSTVSAVLEENVEALVEQHRCINIGSLYAQVKELHSWADAKFVKEVIDASCSTFILVHSSLARLTIALCGSKEHYSKYTSENGSEMVGIVTDASLAPEMHTLEATPVCKALYFLRVMGNSTCSLLDKLCEDGIVRQWVEIMDDGTIVVIFDPGGGEDKATWADTGNGNKGLHLVFFLSQFQVMENGSQGIELKEKLTWKQELEHRPSEVGTVEEKLTEVEVSVHCSENDAKKDLELLWRRAKTTAPMLTYLKSKARLMAVPHLAHTSCGIKHQQGIGLIDKHGVPLSDWSKDVDLSCHGSSDDEAFLGRGTNLDANDWSYIGEILKSVHMVSDVMESLVKRVIMAETEAASEKHKVNLGLEEIERKTLQIENMSAKVVEMENFALGTNGILNEMRLKVEEMVEETSRQRQRAAENEQELFRVKQDFESLRSFVSSLISVREILLSSEKQLQTMEKLFDRLLAKTAHLESEKLQKEAEVQKLVEENVSLRALLENAKHQAILSKLKSRISSTSRSLVLLKSRAKNFEPILPIYASKFEFISGMQRTLLHNLNSSGRKLFAGSFLGLSAAAGMIYNQSIVAYAMNDCDADYCEPSGFLKDDLNTYWFLARKFELAIVLILTVLVGWRHPFALAANIALLLLCTKPSPSSIYMFIEQVRQKDMNQKQRLLGNRFLYVKNANVEDYRVLCLAKKKKKLN